MNKVLKYPSEINLVYSLETVEEFQEDEFRLDELEDIYKRSDVYRRIEMLVQHTRRGRREFKLTHLLKQTPNQRNLTKREISSCL